MPSCSLRHRMLVFVGVVLGRALGLERGGLGMLAVLGREGVVLGVSGGEAGVGSVGVFRVRAAEGVLPLDLREGLGVVGEAALMVSVITSLEDTRAASRRVVDRDAETGRRE